MIQLTIDKAIALYFVLIILFICASWILQTLRAKKKEPLSFQTNVHHCEYCSTSYLERASIKLPRCPACKSYNQGG